MRVEPRAQHVWCGVPVWMTAREFGRPHAAARVHGRRRSALWLLRRLHSGAGDDTISAVGASGICCRWRSMCLVSVLPARLPVATPCVASFATPLAAPLAPSCHLTLPHLTPNLQPHSPPLAAPLAASRSNKRSAPATSQESQADSHSPLPAVPTTRRAARAKWAACKPTPRTGGQWVGGGASA